MNDFFFIRKNDLFSNYLKRKNCRVQKMSRKILRNLCDIFYARHLVFHHCATLSERNFFFRVIFLHSFVNSFL